MQDLKQKTIRGGLARLCAQAVNFLTRLGSLVVLARLLRPADFGLVGMVTAFTGVLYLFRDFGLSSAAVQCATVTNEQLSGLFWVNVAAGAFLALLGVVGAPLVAAFYHEPRLLWVTIVSAFGFLFNAAGVQHSALLQRQMRFTTMAVVNTVGLVAGSAIAIAGAKAGYGYWALVAMTIAVPLISTIGFWLATRWVPGMPRRRSGIRSMVRFGGTLTLNGVVAYIAYNLEKVLLGRYWGAESIGIYGRAYQLVNIPTANLNEAVGEVAFSALSRVQDDPSRLRKYFLAGYSLVLSLTVPLTILCALFADDVVLVFLGPQWKEAVVIFRLLAPTILIFALLNPLGWLMYALGLVGRSLKVALIFAPLIITGYIVGLPYGPKGVAFAYSAVMILWFIPHAWLCIRGTVISVSDVLQSVGRPLALSLLASTIALVVHSACEQWSALPRLALESAALLGSYTCMLLMSKDQKSFYLALFRELKSHSAAKEESLVSA
jgi:O-antigen/teichoic acid export membrane protein